MHDVFWTGSLTRNVRENRFAEIGRLVVPRQKISRYIRLHTTTLQCAIETGKMAAQETQATQQLSVSNGEVRIVEIIKYRRQMDLSTNSFHIVHKVTRVKTCFLYVLKKKSRLPVWISDPFNSACSGGENNVVWVTQGLVRLCDFLLPAHLLFKNLNLHHFLSHRL